MTATLIPGKPVAEKIESGLKRASVEFETLTGRKPGLATILVGNDPSSQRYIAIKQKKGQELGFAGFHSQLDQDATTDDLLKVINSYNSNDSIDAMLIQYPTPKQIDFDLCLSQVDPNKDADGMHPLNMGKLALSIPGPIPCTPAAIEELLKYYDIPVAGKHVAILGRGLTLGRPLSLLLSQKRDSADAAVSILHSGYKNWPSITKIADIVVAAAGVPGILKKDHVKEGSVVIGAGVRYEGKTLLSDVEEDVSEVASFITPRVGGVGPMTVAMLYQNTINCAFSSINGNRQN